MKQRGEIGPERLQRVAIIDPERCDPKRCVLECKMCCPVVAQGTKAGGKFCVSVSAKEKTCKCPFEAIDIVSIGKSLAKDCIHRFGQNGYKLFQLPIPRSGKVVGLIGANKTGKSTALRILSGKLKPNLGRFDGASSDWQDILTQFRGSELQGFFTRILEENIRAIIKPQYIEQIPQALQGTVRTFLTQKNQKREKKEDQEGVQPIQQVSDEPQKELLTVDQVAEQLEITHILDRPISSLSGGELQKFAIALIAVQDVDIYMFDEISTYLDIKQRLKVARFIRDLQTELNYLFVVDHDLSVVEYTSDIVNVVYGKGDVYGVVTPPMHVRDGINVFVQGHIPAENLRFREYELSFKNATQQSTGDEEGKEKPIKTGATTHYPEIHKTIGPFEIVCESGSFQKGEIIVLLGENGTGKTTFLNLIAGLVAADGGVEVPRLSISFKPQHLSVYQSNPSIYTSVYQQPIQYDGMNQSTSSPPLGQTVNKENQSSNQNAQQTTGKEVKGSGKDKLTQQEKAALIEKERIEKEKIEKE
ncbi:MAG: putative ATP-binding cassette sub-family E member 1, partial [Streblomastix strix]